MPHQLSFLPNESIISPTKVKPYQPHCWSDCKLCGTELRHRYTNNPKRKIWRECSRGVVCLEETLCCAHRVPFEGQERPALRAGGWDDF